MDCKQMHVASHCDAQGCHCLGSSSGCLSCQKHNKGRLCTASRAKEERETHSPLCTWCLPFEKRGPRSCCVTQAAPPPPPQPLPTTMVIAQGRAAHGCWNRKSCHCKGCAAGCKICAIAKYKGQLCEQPRAWSERAEDYPLCTDCIPANVGGPRPGCCGTPASAAAAPLMMLQNTAPVITHPMSGHAASSSAAPAATDTPLSLRPDAHAAAPFAAPAAEATSTSVMPMASSLSANPCPGCTKLKQVVKALVVENGLKLSDELEDFFNLQRASADVSAEEVRQNDQESHWQWPRASDWDEHWGETGYSKTSADEHHGAYDVSKYTYS